LQPARPANEVVDCGLRPVAVVDLQRVALRAQRLLRLGQRLRGGPGEHADRVEVVVDAAAYEVVLLVVPDVVQDRRVDLVEGDELRRRTRLLGACGDRKRDNGHEDRQRRQEAVAYEHAQNRTATAAAGVSRRTTCMGAAADSPGARSAAI